jgi:hypothetical protein
MTSSEAGKGDTSSTKEELIVLGFARVIDLHFDAYFSKSEGPVNQLLFSSCLPQVSGKQRYTEWRLRFVVCHRVGVRSSAFHQKAQVLLEISQNAGGLLTRLQPTSKRVAVAADQ